MSKRTHVTLLVALAAAYCGMAHAETHIEKGLARIAAAPSPTPDSFDFVVMGDSNSLDPLVQPDVFKQSVKEINILKPDLVVEVGDLVLGGGADTLPAQWDVYDSVINTLTPPYFPLPGNHDITDEGSEKVWIERMGPTHYSFEYANSCFIMLDSEEMGDVAGITDAQVAWLKEQLDKTKAKNIFVFIHRHFFEYLGDPDEAQGNWDKQWANVANAFKGHPVRVVFAGHEHTYRDCGVRDGVRYVICGGQSVYGMGRGAEEGYFNHYLRVRVRGTDVSWAVIKPGSVLPEDTMTGDRIAELYRVRHKWISADEVFAPLGSAVDQEQHIKISNPHDKPLNTTLTWEAAPGWTVTPQTAPVTVPAGGSQELTFKIASKSPDETRYPVPVFHVRYEQTQFGPPVDVQQNLPLVPVANVQHAKTPLAIDAKFDDWTGAQFAPFTYPSQYDGKDPNDLQAKVSFQWDDENLYMAVDTIDNDHDQPFTGDTVWSADAVEFFLGDWSYGLTLTKVGPQVFMYRGVDVSGQTLVPEVKFAVVRDGNNTRYEAAFPKKYFAPLVMKPGESFRFNALMNDLDANGPQPKRHWLQLIPERGTGGSTPPRVKFVLQD